MSRSAAVVLCFSSLCSLRSLISRRSTLEVLGGLAEAREGTNRGKPFPSPGRSRSIDMPSCGRAQLTRRHRWWWEETRDVLAV